MNFSNALSKLKQGQLLCRAEWPSKAYVFLVIGSRFNVNRAPLLGIYPEGKEIKYSSHLDLCVDDNYVMPWSPTQEDILAEDWEVFLQ